MVAVRALALATLVALAAAKTRWHQLDGYTFEDYKKEYGRSYATQAEHDQRRANFEANLKAARAHNADASKSWKEGVNHMSDWSEKEFRRMLGYNKALGYSMHVESSYDAEAAGMNGSDLPESIDWRDHDIVTAVKNQGGCGSCWTFGATETLESHWAKKTGLLNVLSEQQILDCTPNPQQCGGTGGCQGGTAELAYTKLKETGQTSEWLYPYTSIFGNNSKCHFDPQKTAPIAKVTGYKKIESNQYMPLMQAVGTIGPVSISVEASRWGRYEEGVFDGCNQTNPDIDHAVQLVGYGKETSSGKSYWLVRNSWSPQWGDAGYIKLVRTDDEGSRCGTDISPLDGTGCKGGPKTQKVCGTCGILFDNVYPLVD